MSGNCGFTPDLIAGVHNTPTDSQLLHRKGSNVAVGEGRGQLCPKTNSMTP